MYTCTFKPLNLLSLLCVCFIFQICKHICNMQHMAMRAQQSPQSTTTQSICVLLAALLWQHCDRNAQWANKRTIWIWTRTSTTAEKPSTMGKQFKAHLKWCISIFVCMCIEEVFSYIYLFEAPAAIGYVIYGCTNLIGISSSIQQNQHQTSGRNIICGAKWLT